MAGSHRCVTSLHAFARTLALTAPGLLGQGAGPVNSHVQLVIPCYNERRRLPPFLEELCPAMRKVRGKVTIQVADDGSRAEERDAVAALIDEWRTEYDDVLAPLLALPHRGKGGTILGAWHQVPADASHLAFVDADGAVAAEEVARVLNVIVDGEASGKVPSDACHFAIRKPTATTIIRRDPLRRIVGRVYYGLVSLIMGTDIYDPACGLKVVSRAFHDCCGHLLTEQEWALDIEILARIYHHGFPLREIPVSWEEKGGSKIVRSDVARMLRQIIAVKQRSNGW